MQRIIRMFVLAAFSVAAHPSITAQQVELDAYFRGLASEGTFYGSILAVRGGTTVFRGDYGWHDEAQTIPNAATSVYYTGELSEPFCATLVMMAQEKGLLSLDAPIGTYLTEFRDKPGPRVRDLLSHASGLPVFRLAAGGHATPGSLTLAALAAGSAERPLLAEPGLRYEWQFKDYDLLGYVLEKATGRPYPALFADWIAQPLGLKHTGTGIFTGGKELAWSVNLGKLQDSLALWWGGYQPSTGVYSTVTELDIFFRALASGRLVSPSSLRAMWTPYARAKEDQVGFGFYIEPSGIVDAYGTHLGGYYGVFTFDARQDLRVLILGNRWMGMEARNIRYSLVPKIYAALGLKE